MIQSEPRKDENQLNRSILISYPDLEPTPRNFAKGSRFIHMAMKNLRNQVCIVKRNKFDASIK